MKRIPLHSLVIMVGPSGAGKSTLISKKFPSYEVVSSDAIREELTGDFMRQDINDIVFREVHRRIALKLDLGERVVVDATNLRRRDRIGFAEIGLRHGVPIYYIVVNRSLSEKESTQGWHANVHGLVKKQHDIFLANEREILRGDHIANVIDTRAEDFEVVSKLPKTNILSAIKARGHKGIMAVGDVHGMSEALKSALDWASARNLFVVFLGDIIDHGPNSLECVDRIYDIVMRGKGILAIGNHERKIDRWIDQSRDGEIRVKLSDGNKVTTRAIEALNIEARRKFENKFKALLSFARHHWIIGDTMFVHGAAEPEMFNIQSVRLTGRFESIALFGEVDNTVRRDDGYPNRIYTWVDRIPQGKRVIVGHDIRSSFKPLIVSGAQGGEAIFMDTGSGKGGRLTTADIMFNGDQLVVKNFTTH